MRVALGPLLGSCSTTPRSPSSSISLRPGKEPPQLTDEAIEVRYFAPDEIPWPDLAFPTTIDALTAWVASTRKSRQSP